MKKSLLLFYVLGLSFFLFSCQTGMNDGIPAEYFFQSAKKSIFRISPDGKYISYLEDYKGMKNIFILDLAKGDIQRITTETEQDVKFAFWANNDELIYLMKRSI